MRLTVIGYWGAYPKANEATSGYLLEYEGSSVLIDCGSGVLSQLQNYISLEDLDAVVLSHYHADHLGDVYSLQYAMMILNHIGKRKKTLKIYAPGRDVKFETLSYGQMCSAHPIDDGSRIDIHGMKFSFYKTAHPVDCLGMRIEFDGKVLSYTADTEWTVSLKAIAENSDLLLCECNLYNNQKGRVAGHMTAGDAGKLAAEGGVKELLLTHLPHYGEHEDLIQQAGEYYNGKKTLASTGLKYEF